MAIQQDTDFIPQSDEFSTENLEARPGTDADLVKSGWGAAEEATKRKEYTKEYTVTETPQLVKFLDEGGPYAVYSMHWLDGKSGQKSYVCIGEGCPLCKLPNEDDRKVSKRSAFSVVLIAEDGTATLTKLNASALLFRSLHAAEHSPAGPLTKNYWSVSRRGSFQTLVFTVTPVKGRDLLEDYGIDEAKVLEQLATMSPFDASSVRRHSREELEEIATQLL